jgi:hypothetical protein
MGCSMSCLPLDSCCPDNFPLPTNPIKFSHLCLSGAAPAELDISHFASGPRDILGQGGFGYVRKATKRLGSDAGTIYAIKVMRKDALVVRRRGVQCVLTELALLQDLAGSPFLCAAHYAFQDAGHLYLVSL